MTWEWVVLILGILTLFSILLGFTVWTNMQFKTSELYARNYPKQEAPTEVKANGRS